MAESMALTLKKGVVGHSGTVSKRRQAALMDVLTPEQSVKFLNWIDKNKSRCRSLGILQEADTAPIPHSSSLDELCLQLDRSLKIEGATSDDEI